MSRSAIIHVGLPKTATTSFQNALYENRDRLLADSRIFYPSIEANHTDALCAMFLPDPRSHITVQMMGVKTLEDAERLRRQYFDDMERDIESADWDTLVFSAEGLSNLPASALSNLCEWVSKYVECWTVLFWPRHPIGYTKSNMQQMLKGGWTLGQMTSSLQLPNFKGKLTNSFRAFGKNNVVIKTFEDASTEAGGVVAAFCRQIGLGDDLAIDIAKNAKIENESMSMLAAYVLDSLNRQRPLIVDGVRNNNRAHGDVTWINRIKGQKFDLPTNIKQRILIEARPDIKWLNETFGTSHYLDVFSDDISDMTDPTNIFSAATLNSLTLLISDLINKR